MGKKRCPKCSTTKSFDEFHKDSRRADGMKLYCKKCRKSEEPAEKVRKRKKRYRESNKESIKEYMVGWRRTNPEKVKEHSRRSSENRDKESLKEYNKKYKKRNRESVLAAVRDCHKKYKERYRPTKRAALAKYRAKKLHATPKWLSKSMLGSMREFYKNCPEGHQVDHIVPLQGKEVSGLHVLWNLQYLTAGENRRKGNKLEQYYG